MDFVLATKPNQAAPLQNVGAKQVENVWCPKGLRKNIGATITKPLATSPRYLFSRQQRLRTRAEFQRVQTQGKPSYGRYFTVIVYCAPTLLFPRLGILTSRRYGKANQRTRIRRMVRETFRLSQHHFEKPCDILVIPKSPAQTLNYSSLREELLKLWLKLNLLKS